MMSTLQYSLLTLLFEYSDVPVPSNPDALEIAISKNLFLPEEKELFFIGDIERKEEGSPVDEDVELEEEIIVVEVDCYLKCDECGLVIRGAEKRIDKNEDDDEDYPIFRMCPTKDCGGILKEVDEVETKDIDSEIVEELTEE